ncbi:hypothetical protein [Methanocella arvoryzae]|uniref:Uncharacterized protein n=1 Tax=Methanocella arvoryzae (strain DSM 22066 / NBRC 105507 / MRE50) TaxID=351160 RepID=Q0W3Z2_METAR|nr:hypothetical protein [Methanocella arvoryzae]CAJ36901.1 hypothetical protein RCIX1677 [Methanocella arvoryzae MRE50]
MGRADKIVARLPHFYRGWDKSSAVRTLAEGVGMQMDEAEKDLARIMRSHWVDTASGEELDRMGQLFSVRRKDGEPDREFRGRLKAAIISYKGGGTTGSICMLVRITLGLPPETPVTIEENPAVSMRKEWKVRAGMEWTVNPVSVEDAVPEITITVNTEGARISDPTLANLTTGESITFKGDMAFGDTLVISAGKATLNGSDVTPRMSTAGVPALPRRRSKWRYTEAVGANVGAFDEARFDQSVFAIDISSTVTMEWTARRPATFVVNVPRPYLDRAGISARYLQDLIDGVKACGVRAEIKVV